MLMRNILKFTLLSILLFSACKKSDTAEEPKTTKTGVTVAGGNGAGSAANQLNNPSDVFVDFSGNIYVADAKNDRIQKWAPGATIGTTVAGGNGRGYGSNQLNNPQGIFLDKNGTIYIADSGNSRVQKWAAGATNGITIAGRSSPTGPVSGGGPDQFDYPSGVFVDASDNLYVADEGNHRIQKWAPGATSGSTVAGRVRENGNANNLLHKPKDVYVDSNGAIFVVDHQNCRIQKWAQGSTIGTTVAGQNKPGSAAEFLAGPTNIFIDQSGNIFISDLGNNRIQKWTPGGAAGITVAGGNESGSGPNQLSGPTGVFADAAGNIFVADWGNNRIQKWVQ